MKKEIDKQISGLEKNINALVKVYHNNRNELLRLKEENKQLRSLASAQKKEIEELKDKSELKQLAAVVAFKDTDGGKDGLKRKIDEYVREIDQCIAFLSQKL